MGPSTGERANFSIILFAGSKFDGVRISGKKQLDGGVVNTLVSINAVALPGPG